MNATAAHPLPLAMRRETDAQNRLDNATTRRRNRRRKRQRQRSAARRGVA